VPHRRPWLLVTLVAAVVLVPSAALATHVFTDVRDDSTHAPGIEFVAEVGITRGCTDTRYCPNDAVTRQQMATFLHRTSGFAEQGPLVNALLLGDTYYFENLEVLELEGGRPGECVVAEPLGIELGLALVTHELVSAPGGVEGLSPASVNVAVDYDGGDAADEYAVCFQTLDGSDLPAGEYETIYRLSAMIGGAGAASAAGGPGAVDLQGLQAALEAKSDGRR
jgi:hypothetical protein